jgi:hypothetical protein
MFYSSSVFSISKLPAPSASVHNAVLGTITDFCINHDNDIGGGWHYISFALTTSNNDVYFFAIPLSGGSFSTGPNTYLTDIQFNQMYSTILTLYNNGVSNVLVYWNRTWTRDDGQVLNLCDRLGPFIQH